MTMQRQRMRWVFGLCLSLATLGLWGSAAAQSRTPDVEYVPTPHQVVAEMLRVTGVTKDDVVYDLGCGDGRLVITAAKEHGARGVGIDIDPQRIKESRENARQSGVSKRVKFLQQDLFETDFREATVVTLYLLPKLNLQLRPKLLSDLKPGTRVVSHDFDMDDWQPDKMLRVPGPSYEHSVYFWIIPADVAGTWRVQLPEAFGKRQHTLRLQQQFQEVKGAARLGGDETVLTEATLTGTQLRFTTATQMQGQQVTMQFDGHVNGEAIKGNVEVQGGPFAGVHAWTAKRETTSATTITRPRQKS
jgi:SAM-dependent methyltransferase